jgi:hypothetical protein
MDRSSSEGLDGILRESGHGDDACCPVALKVEDRVLNEAKMSFTLSPRARNNCHEVGNQFLLKDLEFCFGSLLMQVRVTWGIWARTDLAETVSNMELVSGASTNGRRAISANN